MSVLLRALLVGCLLLPLAAAAQHTGRLDVPVENRADAMAMLDRGEVDAYAGDRGVLIGQAMTTKTRTPQWTLLDVQFSYEPYAFAMPRGDPALRLAVNRALTGVYRSRQIEDVYGRWLESFGPPPPLVQAMFLLNQIPE